MRTPLIAANWKMYKTTAEAAQYGKQLLEELAARQVAVSAAERGEPGQVAVVVCPPFTALGALGGVLAGSPVALGAQNMHWEAAGAYTGEIAATMLLDVGCRYVILGHSERRQMGETDEQVQRKVQAAAAAGLIPIVCVGERIEERRAGETEAVVTRQVRAAFTGLGAEAAARAVIAYEPVWAIGTGEYASPEEANRVIGLIRDTLGRQLGAEVADAVRILYGGSVKPDNVGPFVAQPEIDGALVGGASLDAKAFAEIIKQAEVNAA
ncbi:MAG: triose-phosphate isomerase [Firmicutes bacterium ZCTH02-B6]|nr:MAG: triose-phosphate isomerase [Firmicutes bacterium ZCTH02-B6]